MFPLFCPACVGRSERTTFWGSLGDYDLLITDDLEVERNTEYALEQMFSIPDRRYRCNKPLIVATNLKQDEMKQPTSPTPVSMTRF